MTLMTINNRRMLSEIAEEQRKRIEYLETKVREYESEIAQLKYFIQEENDK